MANNQNEVLALQEMEYEVSDQDARVTTSPVCVSVISGITGGIWNSSISFSCKEA
ncbi:Uncharacterised protein [[Clostridium] sordellii]|uniref:Uncharacterized protein n=2 Tax=Paraclostridium sordellii TaxID=1505 RepID=A0A9P1L0Y0_PARSO|nr:Uncharacterised protein [[Clostridium] sordellii] [Paeniclostridium sordellii]